MATTVQERVHQLYWQNDINCARTALICLSELYNIKLEPQTINSAIDLHGAGGYRAQCGLSRRQLNVYRYLFKSTKQNRRRNC